jgi:hypothetical protein
MKVSAICTLLVLINSAIFASPQPVKQHRCASDAVELAKKLVSFHVGPLDHSIDINREVITLAPMRNPASPAQRLDVLEVWGSVYKGNFRMRFTYIRHKSITECVMVGQEILNYAKF